MSKAEEIMGCGSAKEDLEPLSDAELLREAARELSKTVIRVTSATESLVAAMLDRPGELAVLIHAIVACCQAADHAHAQAEHMERQPLAVK